LSGVYSDMSQNVSSNAGKALRTVGVDDGGFQSQWPSIRRQGKAVLAAVLLNEYWIDDIHVGEITVDGLDATEVLEKLLNRWEFDAVFLSGVSFAGFNLIDAEAIHKRFGRPVVVVSGDKPDNVAVKKALQKHFTDWEARWKIVRKLGRIYSAAPVVAEPPLYFEAVGLSPRSAKLMIRALAVSSRLPEPIRVARLVARGLTRYT